MTNIETIMKTQKRTLKSTGSFYNWLMGNNSTLPEVGKGATILMWTDRYAFQVIWVSEDQSECIIQRCDSKRIDMLGMSDCQDYDYSQLVEGSEQKLVWKSKKGGCWCREIEEINWTPEYLRKTMKGYCLDVLTQEEKDAVFGNGPMKYVQGITRKMTKYYPVNIIFGVQKEYYDFSF